MIGATYQLDGISALFRLINWMIMDGIFISTYQPANGIDSRYEDR
jgi:hypothetical protein